MIDCFLPAFAELLDNALDEVVCILSKSYNYPIYGLNCLTNLCATELQWSHLLRRRHSGEHEGRDKNGGGARQRRRHDS